MPGSLPCVCRGWDCNRLCTLGHCLACLSRGLLGGGVSKPPLPPRSLAGRLPAPQFLGAQSGVDFALPSLSEADPSVCAHLTPLPPCSQPELPALPSTLQSGSLWGSHPRGCIWCLWPGASRRGPDWTALLAQAVFTSRARSELCSSFQSQPRARQLCFSFQKY